MATLSRRLTRAIPFLSYLVFRSAPSLSLSTATFSTFLLQRLRPLSAAPIEAVHGLPHSSNARSFSTRKTSCYIDDPTPEWSNPSTEPMIHLPGCDDKHWLVMMKRPKGNPTRDEIIDSYIKTLAQVVGSEKKARKKIYLVSTRCYWAFGALVSEEQTLRIIELPGVRQVLPDSYEDVRNKDYGGIMIFGFWIMLFLLAACCLIQIIMEPFIDGKAVPYDPKYHEEWIRNHQRKKEEEQRNRHLRTDPTKWNAKLEKLFIDVIVNEVNKGNMNSGKFDRNTWLKIYIEVVNQGRCCLSLRKLKYKFSSLHAVYHEFSDLLKHNGISWDVETNRLHAEEETWHNCIQSYPNAKKISLRGMPALRVAGIDFLGVNSNRCPLFFKFYQILIFRIRRRL